MNIKFVISPKKGCKHLKLIVLIVLIYDSKNIVLKRLETDTSALRVLQTRAILTGSLASHEICTVIMFRSDYTN